MLPVCDVQSRKIDTSFRLTKVGVSGVRKLIYVARPNNEIPTEPLVCTIDVSVDLPADQKGSHMSRNLEVIREIISENIINPVTGIEDLAVQISKLLLEKHEYATIANVNIEAEYFKNSVTPHGKKTTEIYTLIGGACDQRGQTIHKTVGVRCIGMAACPCAQENITQTLGCSKKWPVITHNQRNICSVMITMDENVSIEADDLIDLINESFSSPTFELLKRDDEAAVVIDAHNNPKFVEDIVRVVLKKITDRYSDVPDDVRITVRSESEESIHKHNAFAEKTTTMAELRR
ncbi:MAG: GTP cyclohydrolase MptA [archaeon]|nr:GTP cyclohydrolase MptA [archaeon]